jgi:hypothetical protein
MSSKDAFWIGAKGGLLEHKHIRAMGPSVWMFLYLLRGQTALNEAGEGVFNYGHPTTLKQVSYDLNGTPVATIRRWVARLKKTNYIRVEDHSHYGITIWISKGKSKTRVARLHTEVTPKVRARTGQSPRAEMNGKFDTSSAEMNANDISSRHDLNTNARGASLHSVESKTVAVIPRRPIPKGFTSENLSNYNKAFTSPFSLLSKEKNIPEEKPTPSGQQLEARRRMLLKQAEQLTRKYPSGEREAVPRGASKIANEATL